MATPDTLFYPKNGNDATFQLEEDSWWYQHRNKMIVEAFRKYFNSEELFADIGGGNGVVAKALQDAGANVIMIEPYPEGIQNATARGVLHTCNVTVEEVHDNMGIMQLGLFDVLEHLPNDSATLQHLYSILPSGGKMMITVPAFQQLFSNTDTELGHFRRYSKDQLKSLAHKQGFKVLYCGYFFGVLYLPMWFFRKILSNHQPGSHEKRRTTEHTYNRKWLGKLLRTFLFAESYFLRAGKGLPVGTSCLLIAEKS